MQGRILVVDDVAENRKLITAILKKDTGYEITTAKSGKAVLSLVTEKNKRNPDLILLDIMMPEMNGVETANQLKKNKKTKNIPIIFLTTLDDEKSKILAFESGGADYITKPFEPIIVQKRIKTHLELEAHKNNLEKIINARTNQYKEAKQEAEEKATQAENALKVKSQFMSTMSHELRTPMNGVIGMVDVLLDSGLTEEQNEYARRAGCARTIVHGERGLQGDIP